MKRCSELALSSKRVSVLGVFAMLIGIALLSGCAATSGARPSAGGADAPRVAQSPATLSHEADERFEAALARMRQGRRDEAREMFEALVADYPTLSGPLTNLGILHARGDEHAVSLRYFERAVSVNPNNAMAYNWMGTVHREQGAHTRARRAYERAIALQPDYAAAHRNLGVLLDVYLQRSQQAIAHYRHYLAYSSDEDPIVHAWIRELEAGGISTARFAGEGS